MSSPLAVRLSDGNRDQHVTDSCPRLSFTKTAPGGHQSAQLRLNIPRADWPDLGDADRIWLYDKRTSKTIWEGYTNAPGTSQDRDAGEGFDLSAYGGMSLASDDRRALVYIDRTGDQWIRPGLPQTAQAEWTHRPNTDIPGVLGGFPPGYPIGTGSPAGMEYRLDDVGMQFGAWSASMICGATDANYTAYVSWNTGGASPGEVSTYTASTSAQAFLNYAGDGTIPAGIDRFGWQFRRSGGATTVADDLRWGHLSDVAMLGRRVDKNGTLLTGSSGMVSATYVLASAVVADLVGRMLPLVDAAASTIIATTVQIKQLAYSQAVTARTVLDDLALWEPNMVWEILHTTSTGKHLFNYRAWPTTARYEISTRDSYTQPSTDSGLCNRIAVNYTDPNGKPDSLIVTATVAALGTRVRHADPINLPQGQGDATDAATIGAAVLADINAAADSARAVVLRPIVDLATGNMVQPWEIEPGYLARVRETGDVLRVTQVDYSWTRDGGDSSATLSLGTPRLTVEQRVARLDRKAFAL